MTLEFQGAARTVTGSMHVLHIAGHTVLLDCGLFQGKRAEANQRNREFPFDPKSIDVVVLSHAHIDHSGNLPNLVKQGYRGAIYSTPATRDLCQVMLSDSGHIQEKDAEFLNRKLAKQGEPHVEPLYGPEDVAETMKLFRTAAYSKEFGVIGNATASFTDAGHILGSASVLLRIRQNGATKTLGFTGDVGPTNLPIVRDPVFPGNVEMLISESTYGGILHDAPDEKSEQLCSDIRRTVDRGGKTIVPAFSVGRTQDIVFALHKLFDEGKLPRIPIYVDSPLAVNATDIFKRHPECFDEETYSHITNHHDPFGLSQLTYVRSSEESKKLNELKKPCVIIAASGMCEAGRILHHLANNVEDPRNMILIVGYQAEHTLGRRLVEQQEEVKIFGTVYKRKAEVVVRNSFSAHADGNGLLKYISKFDKKQLQKIFLVHGDYQRQIMMQEGLKQQGNPNVDIPERGQKFEV
ncbi:MAG TPA: MBL fold metallo-hydrolase [Bacteroidota bacterium]|jgi:metallo-beta-lactamase family protein|nr:MBL fold metallo-hydrolase [Bacteroidota bacterium]